MAGVGPGAAIAVVARVAVWNPPAGGRHRIKLLGADGAVGSADAGTLEPALVEIVHGRRRANGLVARVDRWAPRFKRDGLRRSPSVPTTVCTPQRRCGCSGP